MRRVIAWVCAGLLSALCPNLWAIDQPSAELPSSELHGDLTAPAASAAGDELEPVVVLGRLPTPAERASQRIAEAARLLKDVPLHYTYARHFFRETLRGRPVVFAAWSERGSRWHVVEIEVPFPTPRLRPGRPLSFRVLTAGYDATHVRGVGAERLMFDLYRDGEKLRVYGRKYPMIDMPEVKKLGVRNAVANAETTEYLPLTDDSAPLFVSEGESLLRRTAETALRELRQARVASFAYPERLLADTVLPETLMSLAVIEQTDDNDFTQQPAAALRKTIGHYGMMQSQAFTYSVSRANAAGPMQFTNRRGRGTYAMVVRRCQGADISPDFDSGARDLRNAMKAAACLLDLDLADLPREVQDEYLLRPAAVSIFEVAAYNGGGRNAGRLLKAVRRLQGDVTDLRVPDEADFQSLRSRCPCVWLARNGQTTSLTLPSYNRENMGYVDKYLRFMSMMQATETTAQPDALAGAAANATGLAIAGGGAPLSIEPAPAR